MINETYRRLLFEKLIKLADKLIKENDLLKNRIDEIKKSFTHKKEKEG